MSPLGTATVIQGDARALPLPDGSVDLICTSPPYWNLRSYQDGGEHFSDQIGSEPNPQQWLDNLWECTEEWIRVLKPEGSIWVNLGDVYAGKPPGPQGVTGQRATRRSANEPYQATKWGMSHDGDQGDWTQASAAWLAGVLDCEGSVSIRTLKTPKGTTSFVPWMRVGMMDPQVCARIREITGVGRLFQDGRGVYNWHVASQQARYVLERIWPHLLIKQRQALAAIELARHVADRKARGVWSPLTDTDVAYRLRITEAVRAWNQRQAHEWEPPMLRPMSLPHAAIRTREKSLRGLPWRYAIGCIDRLGLILRRDQIWSKPNHLPESATDRTASAHEYWFHLVKQPRYYSAVDEIREEHLHGGHGTDWAGRKAKGNPTYAPDSGHVGALGHDNRMAGNPLGKLPGSVWTIPTEPLQMPPHLGVDHFAAYPTEWPRRIITGWTPAGICVECGEGRRPVSDKSGLRPVARAHRHLPGYRDPAGEGLRDMAYTITGYVCACTPGRSGPQAPTRPSVIVDPFGGTGTTALVAKALGRHGITIDLSADYCRMATWRVNDPGELAKAGRVPKPPPVIDGQMSLFDGSEPLPAKPSGGLAYAEKKGRNCAACGYRTQYAKGVCDRCRTPITDGGVVA